MTCSRSFVTALALLVCGTGPVSAGIYDAFADFNLTGTNPLPGNPWAYGTETALGGTFTPMSVFSTFTSTNDSTYFYNQNLLGPAIGKNTGTTTINLGGGPPSLLWPTDVLLVAPGGQNNPGTPNFSVVRWTAPVSGTYDIGGFFMNLQEANTDVYVVANTASGLVTVSSDSTTLTGGEPYWTQVSFGATDLSMFQGQTIEFIVGNRNYPGLDSDDVNGLSATIQSVPEPSSIVMAIIGLGLAGGTGVVKRNPGAIEGLADTARTEAVSTPRDEGGLREHLPHDRDA